MDIDMLQAKPISGAAPLNVTFTTAPVKLSPLLKFRLDFGDGQTADTFSVPKMSGTLDELTCSSTSDGEVLCAYEVSHVYESPGTYVITFSQVGLCASDPPRCGETKTLARLVLSVS